MSKSGNFRTEKLSIPANSSVNIPAVGTFVRVRNATATLILSVQGVDGGQLADYLEVSNGDKPTFNERFKLLTFRNPTAATVTADVVIGEGNHEVSSIAGTVAVTNSAASTFDSQADVSLTTASSLDIAVDLTRREILLQGAQANTGELCVRDQSGTTSEGFRLYAGGHLILGNYAALRIRNNSAATQVLQYALSQG